MKALYAILALAVALLAGTVLAPLLTEDPGYVLIRFQGWAVETTPVALALALLAAYAALRLAWWLLGLPRRTYRHAAERRRRTRLEHGLLALMEGRWHRAERQLARAARRSRLPVVGYLAAARAAQRQHAEERTERYLALADSAGERAHFPVELTRAELLLDRGEPEGARPLLETLHAQRPRHPQLQHLLLRCYRALEDWDRLADLTGRLGRNAAVDERERRSLQREAAAAGLRLAADAEGLERRRQHLSRELRGDAGIVAAYAGRARELGADAQAEGVVLAALKQDCDARLLRVHAELPVYEPAKRRKTLEHCLTRLPDEPAAYWALARVERALGEREPARQHLEEALELAHWPGIFAELAALAEDDGDFDRALVCYRNAVRAARGDSPEPMPEARPRMGMEPRPALTDQQGAGEGAAS